ncbi:MAG: selenide, water dikinase SelD [Candidatus Obscuribacterales bacterium]|nr:selenide, water dikinase SelD [Candidatus Obscuribacterales bacterium]
MRFQAVSSEEPQKKLVSIRINLKVGTGHMSSAESKKLTANIKAYGCAAKISSAELAQIVASLPSFESDNLLTGTKNFEDAAVYKMSDDLAIVSTIDFFPPLLDDPFMYGKIAAVNALSDVYAMGGKPLLALNVFCFPTCDYPLELAQQIIAGGAQAVREAGCLLVGGHSIQSTEPIYGLAVTGTVHPDKILMNAAARADDAILLCKPIGSGVSFLARKGGELSDTAWSALLESLCRLNGPCLEIAAKFDLHAATDITGFGLIGHLHEMAQASGLTARIASRQVPLLDEVEHCAEQGLVPAAAYANRNTYSKVCRFAESVPLALSDLMFDPQTSGGLLFSLAQSDAELALVDLQKSGWKASIIGKFIDGDAGVVEVF